MEDFVADEQVQAKFLSVAQEKTWIWAATLL